jgi:hypothetical protein
LFFLVGLGFFGDVHDFPCRLLGRLIEKSNPILNISVKCEVRLRWNGPIPDPPGIPVKNGGTIIGGGTYGGIILGGGEYGGDDGGGE